MGGGLDRLGPALGPLDRSAQQLGCARDQVILGIGADLASEAAADVLRDDAESGLAEAERAADKEADEVRVLAREPERHRVVRLAVLGSDRPGLHRRWRQSLLVDPLLDLHLGRVEGFVTRLPGDVGEVPADVVGRARVGRRAAGERLLEVAGGREHFVIDLHQVGGVGGLVLGLGDDDGDRLALETDLALGDRVAVGRLLLLGDEGRGDRHEAADHILEVGGDEHGDDPGCRLGGGGVEARDPGMRVGAADDHHVRGPGPGEVVRVAAVAGDEARVLPALDAGADHLADRHLSPLRRRRERRRSLPRPSCPPRP